MSKKSKKKGGLGMPSRSPSLESTASQSLAPAPRATRRATDDDRTSLAGVQTHGTHLFDSLTLLIYCPKHKNFALSKINPQKGLFLPYVVNRPTEGWYMAVISKLKQLLAVGQGAKSYLSFSPPEMIHTFRLQVPSVCRFITRVTYFAELTHDDKHPTNCCQGSRLSWLSATDVSRGAIAETWGPEPAVFGEAFMAKSVEKGAYTEFTLREAFRYVPRDPPKTFQEEMVASAKMGEREISKIYAEFIQHCYPSQYMVLYSFADYLTKLGWTSSDMDLTSTHRALCFNNRPYMSFHEFLLGIAAMDKHTLHGGHPGELRCGYIFRYYDANQDGLLDKQEMFNLTADILRLKNKPYDRDAVEKEVANNFQVLKLNINEPINMGQLARGIGTMGFRGSSALFRCSFNVMQQINLKKLYDSVSMLHATMSMDAAGGKGKIKGICPRCRTKKYTLASHSLRVTPDGRLADPVDIVQDDIAKMSKDKRQMSNLSISSDYVANKALEYIREFNAAGNIDGRSKGKGKPEQTAWVSGDRGQMSSLLLRLCTEAEALFRVDGRCVKLNSPAYILGDIHGNLHDLMIYEKTLWEKGPLGPAGCYLFLGDYVDRGDFGLEVVTYLLACKVLNPEKFYLLRGNHELRPIQTVFTFQRECSEKFGKAGNAVWEAINKVFDCMPLCGIIDDSIFCAHGGIPTSALKIDELNSIPIPLPDPERQSPAAWEILWNDPISANDFGEYLEMLRIQSGSSAFSNLNGFLPNTRRGTAYYFSEEAVSRFLTANGLSHIVRAHEVIPPGYTFHMGGKVITVFSSSRYCNGTNESAVVFVEQEKLRILRMDTS